MISESEWGTDIAEAIAEYPMLQPLQQNKEKHLVGKIEVVNKASGIHIDTYEVDIFYPEEYPYCFPKVIETSNKIPRELGRHTNPKGDTLCLAVDPEERLLCKYGISTIWFLDNVLVPRLAEEFAVSKGVKYQREYSHGSDGLWEFYMKQFKTQDPNLVLKFIKGMALKQLPKGYKLCICGSGAKFKKCHLKPILKLNMLGNDYLLNTADYLENNNYTGGNL